jgi:2-polyprenyl-3-methyl-5-hydroxy-6-metoxy-1,4-benzoquinol methylase
MPAQNKAKEYYTDGMLRCNYDHFPESSKDLFISMMELYGIVAIYAEGKTVLDLPCGDGSGSALLVRRGKASAVLGVDVDTESVEKAARTNKVEGIEYRLGSCDALGKAERFDVAACINTIKHNPDPPAFLARIRDHIKPGGELFVSAQVTPTMDVNSTHLCDFTPSSFRRMLRRLGFRIAGEYTQLKRFQAGAALSLAGKKRAGEKQEGGLRRLMFYYLLHPHKAFARARSLIRDGLVVKMLMVRAILDRSQ